MATYKIHTCETAGSQRCNCQSIAAETARLVIVFTAKDGSLVKSIPFDQVTGVDRGR